MSADKIYAIGNAHLDPIWLWTRSSGRSSMLNTIRSSLKILKENPDVRFTCSSSDMYRWCEETAPELFEELSAMIREGRWEITGGWEVQSDSIITSLEVHLRQADFGQSYFKTRFGKTTETAYSVDSFGHTAMLPAILQHHGFKHYILCRANDVPGLFRWTAPDGSSVIAHKLLNSYGVPETATKDEFFQRLREHWKKGDKLQTFFYGVGDHGGGLTRAQVAWIREAAASGIPVVFSTLEEYFRDVENSGMELPEYSGEIAPNARAVYTMNHDVKKRGAQAQRHLLKAERLGAPAELLELPWRELAFNHFHDILPGTSIRKAYDHDVYPSLGFSDFTAQEFVDRQLGRMESGEDLSFITEGGVQVWNPHPFKAKALVSVDGFTDPNLSGEEFCSLKAADGTLIPMEILPAASSYGPCLSAWGRMTAVVEIPPMSTRYFAYSREPAPLKEVMNDTINRLHDFLGRISLPVLYDNNGSWGFTMEPYGMATEWAALENVNEVLRGQVCSMIQAEYSYKTSKIRLELTAYDDFPEIGVKVHIRWNEPNTCLKLAIRSRDVPERFFTGNAGGITDRQIPSHTRHLVRMDNGVLAPGDAASTPEYAFTDFFGFSAWHKTTAVYAPDLFACDYADHQIRLTLLRPAHYADFVVMPPNRQDGWADFGYTHTAFWFLDQAETAPEELPNRAAERLLGAEVREVTGHAPERTAKLEPVPPESDLTGSPVAVTSYSRGGATLWNPTAQEQTLTLAGKKVNLKPHEIIRIKF